MGLRLCILTSLRYIVLRDHLEPIVILLKLVNCGRPRLLTFLMLFNFLSHSVLLHTIWIYQLEEELLSAIGNIAAIITNSSGRPT